MSEIDPKFFSYVQYFSGKDCIAMVESEAGTSVLSPKFDALLEKRVIRQCLIWMMLGNEIMFVVENETIKVSLPTDKVIRKRFRETFRDFLSKPLRGTQRGLGGVLSL